MRHDAKATSARSIFLVVVFLFLGLAFSLASASAAPISGFFPSEDAEGTAGGQFSKTPGVGGVAVNELTGDVYVVDRGNNRIEQFASDGENSFIRAWGVDVNATTPGTEFEICSATSGDVCKEGLASGVAGGMSTPQGIAIDQGSGNVYVTDQGNLRVDEFDSSGHFLRAWGQDVVASGPDDSPATNAVQTLTVTAGSGNYTLEYQGQKTGDIAFNASAATIEAALLSLPLLLPEGVAVAETSPSSHTYTVTFDAFHAKNPEPTIIAASAAGEPLVGGTAEVVSTTLGATGFEICDVVAHPTDVCQGGAANDGENNNARAGAFKSPFEGYPAIAPGGPYAGDVFVADNFNNRVQVFGPNGAFVAAFGKEVLRAGPQTSGTLLCLAALFNACGKGTTTGGNPNEYGFNSGSEPKPQKPPLRLGIDSSGAVYVPNGGRLQKYSPNLTEEHDFATGVCSGTGEFSACSEVAVDTASDDVYVAKEVPQGSSLKEFLLKHFDSTGALLGTDLEGSEVKVLNGLGIDLAHRGLIYASTLTPLHEPGVDIIGEPPTPPTCEMGPVTEIGTHKAKVSGTINPEGDAIHTSYRFEYITSGDPWKPFPVTDVDIGNGTGPIAVSQTLEGLRGKNEYRVRLVALKGVRTECGERKFETLAGPPEVETGAAHWSGPPASGPSLTFEGLVDSNSEDATYYFEYGTTPSYGSRIPAKGSANLAASSRAAKVRLSVDGRDPSAVYHYRLVAGNGSGQTLGEDRQVAPPQVGIRYPELVSPPDKRPVGTVQLIFEGQIGYQAATEGQQIIYPILNGLDDSSAGGELRYLASREGSGWESTQVSAPSLVHSSRPSLGSRPSLVRYFNPDLSCGLVESFNPLTPDTPAADIELGITNLYRINPDGSHTLITNTVPSNPNVTPGIGYYTIAGMSADCNRVFFSSPFYKLLPGASGLYEWNAGILRDAGVLPDDGVASNVGLGGEGTGIAGRVNAVSTNGSRFFFSATSDEGLDTGKRAVFMRENGTSTVDVSQSKTATVPLGARYETASADGSKVFFAANYGLTPSSSSGPAANCTSKEQSAAGLGAACALYSYNVDTAVLTDLSADTNPADTNGAGVEGVLDVSDDGSYVYFAARGQLVAGKGNTYLQNSTAGSANIYLSHNGALSYVGVFAHKDLEDNQQEDGALIRNAPENRSSQATPDGKHLLFASGANVSGYISDGVREAYVYAADADTTVCVSCRTDSQPAVGEADGGPIRVSKGGSHLPRSISEDGSRVFFTSKDVLATGAISGNENIYAWEGGTIHLLNNLEHGPGEFEDASASGEDVFIRTAEQLEPRDTDSAFDVYDLRVNGGFAAPEPASPPCDPLAEECQGPPPSVPVAPKSPSADFVGPANALTPPAKKKRHKKAHKHHHHKKGHKGGHKGRKGGHKRAAAKWGGAK